MIEAVSGAQAARLYENIGGLREQGVDLGSVDQVNSLNATSAASDTFGGVLEQALTEAVGQLKAAEVSGISGVVGTASAQTVVETVMGAERALQTAIAVRNKVVEAYLEISRMQI